MHSARVFQSWVHTNVSHCGRFIESHNPSFIIFTFIAAVSLMVAFSFGLLARKPEDWPIVIAYFVSLPAIWGVPYALLARHRWRQRRIVERADRICEAALTAWLRGGSLPDARDALRSILRLKRRWQFGDGLLFRSAYFATTACAAAIASAAHAVLAANVSRHGGPMAGSLPSLAETYAYLADRPIAFVLMTVLPTMAALNVAGSLREPRTPESPALRLAHAILKGVEPLTETETEPETVQARLCNPVDSEVVAARPARDLLGLESPRFTKDELRRAWLRAVRDLHPDGRTDVDAVAAKANENALKTVNAARDELEPFAAK